jgi:nitrate reductase delta subunit
MSAASAGDLATIELCASVLLQYPDGEILERIPDVTDAVGSIAPCTAKARLSAFLDHVRESEPTALATDYVEAFDFRRRSCLYLTYYTDGDTRRRGVALARLKSRYRAAGLMVEDRELPDFLPVMLEYAALTGDRSILSDHRPALELLRMALAESASPYASIVEAVCGTLPGPTPKDREAALALARNGPPREEVGLEPYAAPGAARS